MLQTGKINCIYYKNHQFLLKKEIFTTELTEALALGKKFLIFLCALCELCGEKNFSGTF